MVDSTMIANKLALFLRKRFAIWTLHTFDAGKGPWWVKPLQFDEAYNPQTGSSEVHSMPFSKAQSLSAAFIADSLKPTTTGLTSYSGTKYKEMDDLTSAKLIFEIGKG
uniref:Uncharacterized protein n=1 Tax=Tanacetum cinerariifolium TaxID=118510 RepID=A0A6L2N8M4_TANCI|nr:hypothetical protein [Tanacetum cinerariifolium]